MYYLNIGNQKKLDNEKKIESFLTKLSQESRTQDKPMKVNNSFKDMQVGILNDVGEICKIIYISDPNTWMSVIEGLKDLYDFKEINEEAETDVLQNVLSQHLEENLFYSAFDILLRP